MCQNQKQKYEVDNQNWSHFDSIIDLNQRIITSLLLIAVCGWAISGSFTQKTEVLLIYRTIRKANMIGSFQTSEDIEKPSTIIDIEY